MKINYNGLYLVKNGYHLVDGLWTKVSLMEITLFHVT